MATPFNDGLVDSPFGRVRPEILDILRGGRGAPAPEPAPEAAPTPIAAVEAAADIDTQIAQLAPATPVDPNALTSHFGRGVDQLQAAGGGAVEVVGEITGSQYLTDLGKDIRDNQLKEAEQYGNPEYADVTEVDITDPASVGSWLESTVGQAAPAMAAVIGSGAAGGRAGAAIGKRFGIPGTAVGATVGAFLGSFGINAGEFQNEVKALNPDARDPWMSVAFGAGAGVLDAAGLKTLVGPMIKHFGRDQVYNAAIQSGVPKKMMLDVMKEAPIAAAKAALVEGGIGATQEGMQAWGASKVSDVDTSTSDILNRMINGAAAGGVLGGASRAGSELLSASLDNANAAGTSTPQAVASGPMDEAGIAKKTWQLLGSKATDQLMPWARVSPEMEGIVRDFVPDPTGATATGRTIYEDAALRSGNYRREMDDAIHGLTAKEEALVYADMSTPAPQTPAGIKLRGIMDRILGDARATGIDAGYVEGFLPNQVDPKRVKANRPAFEALLAKHGYQDPTKMVDDWISDVGTNKGNVAPEITRLVQPNTATGDLEIMSRFRKGDDPDTMRNLFGQGQAVPKATHLEFSRAFADVPQAELNAWTLQQKPGQVRKALYDYAEGAAHRIAYVDRNGINGELANARIAKAVYEAQQQGKVTSKGELDKIYGLLNSYNGMHNRIKLESAKTATAVTQGVLTMAALPLAAIASFTEFLVPAIRGDINSAIYSSAPALVNFSKTAVETLFKGVPRSEWSKLAADAGIDFASSQNILSDRLGAAIFHSGIQKVMQGYFMVQGLSLLTHFQRVYAGTVGKRIFDRNLYALASGLDITSANGARYANQLRSMGVDVKSNADAMALWSPSNPSEVATSRAAEVLAVRRFTTQSILEPTSADLPLWMSDGHMGMIAMLKRYPTAYSNTVLPQMVRKMSPSYAGSYSNAIAGAAGLGLILSGMFAIGYIQDELKQKAKAGFGDIEDNRTEDQRFADVAANILAPMQGQYLLAMYNSQRYGSSPAETALGPAAGAASDLVTATAKTIGSLEDDPTAGYIWQFMYKQTPLKGFKPIQERVKESLDLQ